MQFKYIYIYIITISLLSCKQINKENVCQEKLNHSRKYLNEFYLTNDSNYLCLSKLALDSIECDSFKHRISNIKLSLFYLMKDYENGIIYVESLKESEFQRPYLKKMYLNNFKALLCLKNKNTACSYHYYVEIVNEIENYLDKDKTIEALMDLYVFKSKIYPKSLLLQELDSIKNLNQYDLDYLEALCESIDNGYYLDR